jgi:hypothetical protein
VVDLRYDWQRDAHRPPFREAGLRLAGEFWGERSWSLC